MRIIAAYMLAVLGGNQNPDAAAVKKVLDSVASKYDEKRVDALIAELHGKDIGALIAAGNAKLAALGPISSGGGSSGGDAAPAKGDDKKKGGDDKKGGDKGKDAKAGGDKKGGDKKPKDEPKEEAPAEEEGGDMGMSLFD